MNIRNITPKAEAHDFSEGVLHVIRMMGVTQLPNTEVRASVDEDTSIYTTSIRLDNGRVRLHFIQTGETLPKDVLASGQIAEHNPETIAQTFLALNDAFKATIMLPHWYTIRFQMRHISDPHHNPVRFYCRLEYDERDTAAQRDWTCEAGFEFKGLLFDQIVSSLPYDIDHDHVEGVTFKPQHNQSAKWVRPTRQMMFKQCMASAPINAIAKAIVRVLVAQEEDVKL